MGAMKENVGPSEVREVKQPEPRKRTMVKSAKKAMNANPTTVMKECVGPSEVRKVKQPKPNQPKPNQQKMRQPKLSKKTMDKRAKKVMNAKTTTVMKEFAGGLHTVREVKRPKPKQQKPNQPEMKMMEPSKRTMEKRARKALNANLTTAVKENVGPSEVRDGGPDLGKNVLTTVNVLPINVSVEASVNHLHLL